MQGNSKSRPPNGKRSGGDSSSGSGGRGRSFMGGMMDGLASLFGMGAKSAEQPEGDSGFSNFQGFGTAQRPDQTTSKQNSRTKPTNSQSEQQKTAKHGSSSNSKFEQSSSNSKQNTKCKTEFRCDGNHCSRQCA